MSSGRIARAKAIGHSVEDLVIEQFEALDAVFDENAHHDAVTDGLLSPQLVDAAVPVVWAGIPLVETGTRVEIKAAKRWTDDGDSRLRGRWLLKGRDDGQHAAILDAAGVYALALYDETPAGERVLVAVAIIPASLLDEHLRGRWWSVDRREGTFARLGWPHVIDADLLGGADD